MDAFSNVLRLFYNNVNAVQNLNLASLNLDLRTLPTDAAYDRLRFGDVYRDTQGGTVLSGSNILRIKVPIEVGSVVASGAVGSVAAAKSVTLTGVLGTGTVGTVTP
jgi:hypothetical protein